MEHREHSGSPDDVLAVKGAVGIQGKRVVVSRVRLLERLDVVHVVGLPAAEGTDFAAALEHAADDIVRVHGAREVLSGTSCGVMLVTRPLNASSGADCFPTGVCDTGFSAFLAPMRRISNQRAQPPGTDQDFWIAGLAELATEKCSRSRGIFARLLLSRAYSRVFYRAVRAICLSLPSPCR